jgi:hypothetical protein
VSDFRGPVRALTSYWYYRDIDLNGIVSMLTEDGVPPTLVADSGAFSAYTAGADVTPRLYGDWLDQWPDLFDYAITLDVINDPDASMRSHLECQQVVGRQLVPVIHYGEPVATLDRYYDLGHRLLALGGLALRDMYSEGKRMRWLIPVFRWAEHHPDVRLHGLGIGAFKQMWKLPWWSVDATSWASGTAYGLTAIFDPTTNAPHACCVPVESTRPSSLASTCEPGPARSARTRTGEPSIGSGNAEARSAHQSTRRSPSASTTAPGYAFTWRRGLATSASSSAQPMPCHGAEWRNDGYPCRSDRLRRHGLRHPRSPPRRPRP